MSEFSFDIITDILSRVPVKPLLCFRCVSKQWCSLIDTPRFIKTHLHKSLQNNTNLTLIFGQMGLHPNTLFSPDFHSLYASILFGNHLKNFSILGSCNGLLLLKKDGNAFPCRDDQLVLFNPFTRHYRNVPASPIKYYPQVDYVDFFKKYGLGYDSINDDYKVIMNVQLFDNTMEWFKTEASVYSLKSNLWRKIGDFPCCPGDMCGNEWGAHVNGALHVIAVESEYDLSTGLIVGFDITSDNFYLVPKPLFMKEEEVRIRVDVLGGCLCLIGFYSDYTDVWVMKVYGVKESWTKLFSVSAAEVGSYVSLEGIWPCVPLRLMGYSKSGDEVLFSFLYSMKLMWYDLKGREIKNVEVCDFSKMLYVEVCVGSLVPLDSLKYPQWGEKKTRDLGKRIGKKTQSHKG